MQDEHLSDFILAGGTNLALQIGHRKSVDLDMFAHKSFETEHLIDYLHKRYAMQVDVRKERDTIIGSIDGIKVDMIAHIYPLLHPPLIDESVRMYSLLDIACMKLVAISDNGTRLKDFADIAYLSTRISLLDMLLAYERKYNRPNYFHAIKGLSYFEDIDFNTSIILCNGKQFEWKKIEQRIRDMIKFENKIFETEPI
ncbi:MAG: nucleotidyl transferase AbiEii/AbiGii toxin family protein [Lentimicrobiaceae bacterium]|nr:nucleotidyl transferase AbiEii/AbiGii toxin family protein [Lentimicrobiaceae bacterium]